jgi:SAM-dependent methyltransferase
MNNEYASLYKTLYENHWWWRSREALLLYVIRGLSLSSTVKILDVGCGDGLFFEQLTAFGDVYGVEPDTQIISPEGKFTERIYPGNISDAPFSDNSFGLILACDVIEHIDDDISVLEKMYSLLSPGGILVLTVPAFNMLWTTHDDRNFHKRRYTKRNLEKLVKDNGFLLHKSRYFFVTLFFIKFLQRIFESFSAFFGYGRFRNLIRPEKIPGDFLNLLLSSWYRLENLIALNVNLPLGSSVILILRKQDKSE